MKTTKTKSQFQIFWRVKKATRLPKTARNCEAVTNTTKKAKNTKKIKINNYFM